MQQTAPPTNEWTGKELMLKIKEAPDENNPYYYHKLSGENEIRLVTIKPGKWTDPISCELSCHSLGVENEDVTEYSTLSYAWGSPRITENVTLEGRPWPVTVNLANALLFLRDHEKPVKMWIDALCIDQSNLKERGKQVQLMKEIYSGGTHVIVYLGDGKNHRPKRLVEQRRGSRAPARLSFHNDERDRVHLENFWDALSASAMPSFPATQPLSSTYHLFCLLRVLGDEVFTSNLVDRMRKMTGMNPSYDPLGALVESLRYMLLNPWWQRIWVVQEMIVSRMAVVRCGPVTCPWDMFISAASSLSSSSFNMSTIFRADSAKVLQYFCRQVLSFRDLRNEWKRNLGAPMLTLLQDFSARRATDERDKVFALLGLASHSQRFLALASYEDTVADVYQATAVEVIRQSHSLDIWRGDLARKNRRDLASWVPDWSAVYEEGDRQRAQKYDIGKGEHQSLWKLTVVKSEGEYWKFVAEGMTRLLHWINENPQDRKLPERMNVEFDSYRRLLETVSLECYRKREATILINTVERIKELCVTLRAHCSLPISYEDLAKHPFISAFGRSVAFYREVKSKSELLSDMASGLRDDHSFGTDAAAWLDRLVIWHEMAFWMHKSGVAIHHPFRWDPEKARRHPDERRRKSFFSIESILYGVVTHVGDRLFSWDDRYSAFTTISKWASYCERMPGFHKVKMAKTLLGGASFATPRQSTVEVDVLEDESHRDMKALLLEWLDHVLEREDFAHDPKMKPLNEALILATTGRVMFALNDGTLGLGPGSMAVEDQVMMLPGTSSPIVLRHRLPERDESLEGPAYAVVGDCYLDLSSSDEKKRLPKPWPGWLPESIMPNELKGFWERRRIYLF
ncbi:heterokaryon incompatibility protein-domain-containing protein [Cercophora samala]|uniref:Heterokaryon incompatibility protein-domain-containing protein n=1 Tax=Cercophora samala TaxID=330535 RepID=A0AA39Z3F1_9PEZI|nr:heterokaryon incompatibility protein-domain-containing protein [Cercophora samala]